MYLSAMTPGLCSCWGLGLTESSSGMTTPGGRPSPLVAGFMAFKPKFLFVLCH